MRPAKPLRLALAALVFLPSLVAARQSGAQALERLFYYVDRQDSYESLVRNIDQITILGPQVYTVDSLGIVFGELDSRVLALAKAHRVKVMPLVVNEAFNQPALRKLLADTAARGRATRSLAQLCQQNGFWGIQFDIENVNIEDRDLLTTWYRETANALHRGFTLSIARRTSHRRQRRSHGLPSIFFRTAGEPATISPHWRRLETSSRS